MKHLIIIASSALLTTACFSNAVSPDLVQAKAASDFECANEQVAIEQINDNNWKAQGCGKKATYMCSGSNFMHDGTCMREGALPQ